MIDSLTADILEKSRLHLLSENPFLSNSCRKTASSWTSKTGAVNRSVEEILKAEGLSEVDSLRKEVQASLEFRVMAGILTRPVVYPEVKGGVCAHQDYDINTGNFQCRVPSNQAQVDAWHECFGQGPACPFYEPPTEQRTDSDTELDKMLKEDPDVDHAFDALGIPRHKHI